MELSTYTYELLEEEFSKNPLVEDKCYVVVLDMTDMVEQSIFLTTLAKIDGSIIRIEILDDWIVNKGKFLAAILFTIPTGCEVEFKAKTGLHFYACSVLDEEVKENECLNDS